MQVAALLAPRPSAPGLEVHDLYAVTAGVTAVFQVNVPVEPVMDGTTIVAGELRIVPLVPAAPTVTFLEWASLDPVEFRSGWKVELSGGGGEYVVRLEVPPVIFVDGLESGDATAWAN